MVSNIQGEKKDGECLSHRALTPVMQPERDAMQMLQLLTVTAFYNSSSVLENASSSSLEMG